MFNKMISFQCLFHVLNNRFWNSVSLKSWIQPLYFAISISIHKYIYIYIISSHCFDSFYEPYKIVATLESSHLFIPLYYSSTLNVPTTTCRSGSNTNQPTGTRRAIEVSRRVTSDWDNMDSSTSCTAMEKMLPSPGLKSSDSVWLSVGQRAHPRFWLAAE